MDYLLELGGLALGSRLRRLSERLGQEVSAIYEQQSIEFDPRWFAVFHYVATKTEAPIVEIARAIGITHPAVNQMAQEMIAVGIISAQADSNDKRKRILSLSRKGQKLHRELSDAWRGIRISVADSINDSGFALIPALEALEESLNQRSLLSRFEENREILRQQAVEVIDFEPAYRDDFRLLNEAWIRKYFALEQADKEILSNPESIITDGGAIVFARFGDRVVGTCALVKIDDSTFEIAKMAVSDDFQGLGIGRLLLNECIERARKLNAVRVTLETNTKLNAAVQMYRKAGFKTVPLENSHASKYSRVDLVMELRL